MMDKVYTITCFVKPLSVNIGFHPEVKVIEKHGSWTRIQRLIGEPEALKILDEQEAGSHKTFYNLLGVTKENIEAGLIYPKILYPKMTLGPSQCLMKKCRRKGKRKARRPR